MTTIITIVVVVVVIVITTEVAVNTLAIVTTRRMQKVSTQVALQQTLPLKRGDRCASTFYTNGRHYFTGSTTRRVE